MLSVKREYNTRTTNNHHNNFGHIGVTTQNLLVEEVEQLLPIVGKIHVLS
jgi:hypothetical protein